MIGFSFEALRGNGVHWTNSGLLVCGQGSLLEAFEEFKGIVES